MTIWSDIHKKSNGFTNKEEDIGEVYSSGVDGTVKLYEGKYRDADYQIITNGSYPFVKLIFNKSVSVLDFLTGKSIVRLKSPDGKYYDLGKSTESQNKKIKFTYWFNKDDDYVEDVDSEMQLTKPHPGHKYTVHELKDYCEMFIDLIIDMETELITKHME